jgi:hypothetical protein
MNNTMTSRIQPHNERPAAVWGAGGMDYDHALRTVPREYWLTMGVRR